MDDVQALPLRTIDDVIPSLRWRYSVATGVEGAGAAIVITGGQLVAVFGSVSSAGAAAAPGAGAVIGAMAFDATVLAASARVVAHTAAYYGYDVRQPEEELFALTIINWSSATSEGAKYAAFQQLSRITQQLVRGAPWAKLSEHVTVKVIQEIYASPWHPTHSTQAWTGNTGRRRCPRSWDERWPPECNCRDAQSAYRSRHLVDKYGFSLMT